MWELVLAGGWLMLPIVICSIVTLMVIIERSYFLRMQNITPANLRQEIVSGLSTQSISKKKLVQLQQSSPLGDVLVTGVFYFQNGAQIMAMHMENRAGVQVHKLEKNISILGTVAAVAPLLGLLGTVLGIITSFLSINIGNVKDTAMLAEGVSQALITTAAGMFVAVPAVIAYRYFQRKIVNINAVFEEEAGLLLQSLQSEVTAKAKQTHNTQQR